VLRIGERRAVMAAVKHRAKLAQLTAACHSSCVCRGLKVALSAPY